MQLLAVISPGPSFLITARTSAAQSRADGIKVALGLGAGTVVWSSAALLGLNAVFHAVPALFVGMKIAGALFLLYIAWMIFTHAADPLKIEGAGARLPNPFLKGFLTQISNPKVAVFFGSVFIAMLPSQVPLWMTVTLIAIVSFNEVPGTASWRSSSALARCGISTSRPRYGWSGSPASSSARWGSVCCGRQGTRSSSSHIPSKLSKM